MIVPRRPTTAVALALILAVGCSAKERGPQEQASGDGAHAGAAGASGSPGAGGEATDSPPAWLSEARLYTNLADGEALAPGVVEYRPLFELWADGAEKRRFLFLPSGGVIDTSDMDYWVFPAGTRAFKEFRKDGVRVETRMLEKAVDGTWLMLGFEWNAEGTDAMAVPRGSENVGGTEHDIPSQVMCRECHENMPDTLLGVGAVQLSHTLGDLTLDDLIGDGRLTEVPSAPIALPGDAVAQAALGYLHANCGNCHNGRSGEFPMVHLELFLEVDSLFEVEATPAYRTTVGIPFEGVPPSPDVAEILVTPGDPEGSALYQRMAVREVLVQMPPLATEYRDDDGLRSIASWITALEP
jgi:hypothetical protein